MTKTKDIIQRTREYLDYLERHIDNVQKAWKEVSEKCKDMSFVWDDFRWFSIQEMVDTHDASKLSEAEFVQYRRFFYPLPEDDGVTLTPAWDHHKKENPHHWQNWATRSHYHPYAEECHLVCMVLDWMAMAYELGGSAQEYYEKNIADIHIPDEWIPFLYQIFDRVRGAHA